MPIGIDEEEEEERVPESSRLSCAPGAQSRDVGFRVNGLQRIFFFSETAELKKVANNRGHTSTAVDGYRGAAGRATARTHSFIG